MKEHPNRQQERAGEKRIQTQSWNIDFLAFDLSCFFLVGLWVACSYRREQAKKLKPSVECYNSALNALRQDEVWKIANKRCLKCELVQWPRNLRAKIAWSVCSTWCRRTANFVEKKTGWHRWFVSTIKLTNQPINQQTNQFAEFGEVKSWDAKNQDGLQPNTAGLPRSFRRWTNSQICRFT